jgi:hypothetical protein
MAVGDSVIKEVVKAALIALIALTLQGGIDRVRDRHSSRNPYAVARTAHAALLAELETAKELREEPAYYGEHLVTRIRLVIRCCAARIASISVAWKDAQQYWALLDEVEAAIDKLSPPMLAVVRRKLQILAPPS